MKENRDRSITITSEILAVAKEILILERQTHLDQLIDKLREDRVRSVILPMILGENTEAVNDDIEYCKDLGLVKKENGILKISNRIYHEVIPRELTADSQYTAFASIEPLWLNHDGSINAHTLLSLFKDFWHKNSDIWGTKVPGYKEAAPQLVLQAFLQRVVNGGGRITREYALGYKRTDLFIEWIFKTGAEAHIQNIVLELKTVDKKQKYETVRDKALSQTSTYAKKCNTQNAYLLVFDRDNSEGWATGTDNEQAEYDGINIEIWKLGQEGDEI